MFIVKVQQSLSSSDGVKAVLIYNKDKSVMHESRDPEANKPLLDVLGDEPKAYFEADLSPEGKLGIIARIEDQNW